MGEYKYVMFSVTGNDGMTFRVPVIFPDCLVHRGVAEVMQFTMMRHHWPLAAAIRPVSAGMIGHLEAKYVAGESETLRLKSDPGDEDVINMYPYLHGRKA